jgi:hypothetical protein
MPKNLFQDMVKINSTRKDQPRVDIVKPRTENKPRVEYRDIQEEEKERNNSKYGLWVIAFVSVIFLIFALSFLFSKAVITVKPKSIDVSLSENLFAVKDGQTEDLSFDLVAISGEENRTIIGSEEKELKEEATGTVVVYNTFSSAPQSLDINTRLEGSNGKIYKTDVKIVVPGMKPGGAPGSVEVRIHANEPGEAYNSTPLDFKIFGFKGTSKYNKFYARSKGSITGGLDGKFFTISDEEKNRAVNELKDALMAKLLQKAEDQIPDGFILFKDAVFLNIDSENVTAVSKGSEVPLNIKGTFYGFLFDEKKLTKEIVDKVVPNYDGNPVHISNIKDLAFALGNKETISFKDAEGIYFKLSGTPRVVWDVDTVKLANDVLSRKKKEFSQILLNYPNINSADLVMRPIWKTSFPKELEDIKISVESI